MRVLDAEFVKGFIRMADDGWQQGWHERNGGNLSCRMKPEEVEEVREDFTPGEWKEIGTTVSCTNDESTIINIIVNRDFFNHAFLEILRSGNIMSSFLESILYYNPVNPYILFCTGLDEWLRLLGQHMYTEAMRKPHAFDYSTRLLVSEFILHLVREYEVTAIVPDHKTNAPDDTIVAILGYLSVNYHRATLSDVAAFLGYTPAYLSRKIRKSTGKTFNDIILDLQMGAAVRMIKAGETNLTNIANEIGCFDSSHFSRKFKKYYGCSPREYME